MASFLGFCAPTNALPSLLYSIYKHDTIDIANPSSMQDMYHMDFVIDHNQRRASLSYGFCNRPQSP